jgi:hypothetical protein
VMYCADRKNMSVVPDIYSKLSLQELCSLILQFTPSERE